MDPCSETLFRNDHTIMLLIDPKTGAIRDANRAACRFYGYSFELFCTLNYADLHGGGDVAPFWRHQEDAGDCFRTVGRHRLADGSLRDLEINSGLLELNGCSSLFAVAHDVSRYREAEESRNSELRRKVDELAKSAAEVQDLYDRAPCGYHSLDHEGVFIRINDTELQWLGYQRDEIVGRLKFSDLLTEDSRRTFQDNFPRFKVSGRVSNLEFDLRRKDGTLLPVSLSATTVTDGDGRYLMSRSSLYDITERRRAEHRVHRLNRLYTALSETNKAIVHCSDQDQLFRQFCRIAIDHGGFLLAWIGLVDESGAVRPVASFGDKVDYLETVSVSIREEPRGFGPTGSAIRESSCHVCNDFLNDPTTAPWHAAAAAHGFCSSAAFVLQQNGRTVGAFTLYAGEPDYFDRQLVELLLQMAGDLSYALDNFDREARRRDAELALQQETDRRLRALKEIREKDHLLMHQNRLAAMGEMIGNIAHQWRQPLNTLGLAVQDLALSYELGEFSKELLDARVEKSMQVINHMSRTIDDFRSFFRPDKQKVPFKVSGVIDNTLSLMGGSFGSFRIRVEIEHGSDPTITGYPNEFSQVLLNILNNARDALVERAIGEPIIRIRLGEEEGRTIVTVRDNAGGISEAILDKIFDPYFTTKGPEQGTGLGLFMAKTIIESNMGGSLMATNRGDGAEFRIEV
jgi:PAS domain S-box-containing protein